MCVYCVQLGDTGGDKKMVGWDGGNGGEWEREREKGRVRVRESEREGERERGRERGREIATTPSLSGGPLQRGLVPLPFLLLHHLCFRVPIPLLLPPPPLLLLPLLLHSLSVRSFVCLSSSSGCGTSAPRPILPHLAWRRGKAMDDPRGCGCDGLDLTCP